MRDVAIVVFTPVLAYIVDGLSAISSMLLNLCMYTPVSINLLSPRHYRYAVAVIFTFLIKCSICYLLYTSKRARATHVSNMKNSYEIYINFLNFLKIHTRCIY